MIIGVCIFLVLIALGIEPVKAVGAAVPFVILVLLYLLGDWQAVLLGIGVIVGLPFMGLLVIAIDEAIFPDPKEKH